MTNNKTILVLAIAVAFVAGTLVSGGGAFADKEDKKGNPIVDAINALTLAVQGIDPTVNVDPTPVTVNVDPTPVTLNVDPTPITNNVNPTPVNVNVDPTPINVNLPAVQSGALVPELTVGASIDGVLNIRTDTDAILFYGNSICKIGFAKIDVNAKEIEFHAQTLLIQFATPSTVSHETPHPSCKGSGNVSLNGAVDANFKVGDILIISRAIQSSPGSWTEVYREQS